MSFSKIVVAGIVASSFTFAASAYADDAATSASCLKMSKEVKDALDKNQSAGDFAQAKSQARIGSQYCQNGIYRTGLDHYASALKLMGANGA